MAEGGEGPKPPIESQRVKGVDPLNNIESPLRRALTRAVLSVRLFADEHFGAAGNRVDEHVKEGLKQGPPTETKLLREDPSEQPRIIEEPKD